MQWDECTIHTYMHKMSIFMHKDCHFMHICMQFMHQPQVVWPVIIDALKFLRPFGAQLIEVPGPIRKK